MKKYIICENDAVGREDFRAELDTFGPGMDFCDTVLIIGSGKLNRENTLNLPIYQQAEHEAERIAEEFEKLEEKDAPESEFKDWMDIYRIPYMPEHMSERLEQLRNWARVVAEQGLDFDRIAEFLTIKTRKHWVHDWKRENGEEADFIYCEGKRPSGITKQIDLWFGSAKEYAVFNVDEEGDIEDTISGNIYRIANSDLTDMQDRKEWICRQEGILPEETDLEK